MQNTSRMLRFLAYLLFAGLAFTHAAEFQGQQAYEVRPSSVEQCDLLYKLSMLEDRYDFLMLSRLPNKTAHVLVSADEIENFQSILEKENMQYKVLVEDVQKTLEEEFIMNRRLRSFAYNIEGRLSNDRYYTHAEINSYIEDLEKQYPSRVYVKVVGKSYEKRLLKTLTITNGDGRANKNVILVDGGFHAREWISPAAVLYLINQLVENFSENSDLLLDYDWVILPVANPDGYEYSQTSTSARSWRKTRKPYSFAGISCYGADPNRNFGFHWNEEGASSNPCASTYAGPNAFSEPETTVVRDLIHSLKERGKMYLTVHSYGNYLLYPWGWTDALPDTWEDLDEVAKAGGDAIKAATGTEYTVGSSTRVLYVAAGASDDYAFSVGFPISFTMELPAGGSIGFNPPVTSIDSMVKETWIGIRAMAKKVVEKYPLN